MTWSRVVRDVAEARAMLARPGDAIDLRVAAQPGPEWEELGAYEVLPGELAVPVPQHLPDVAATRALGARLAGGLRAGDLVVLSGPLGAGKTALTQGLGQALGVQGAVTSPTFVLARVHRGPLPLVHVDAYRLRDAQGSPGGTPGGTRAWLDDLELDEELPHSVTVVEWGQGVVEQLSGSRLHVTLTRGDGTTANREESRSGLVRAHGRRWGVVQPP